MNMFENFFGKKKEDPLEKERNRENRSELELRSDDEVEDQEPVRREYDVADTDDQYESFENEDIGLGVTKSRTKKEVEEYYGDIINEDEQTPEERGEGLVNGKKTSPLATLLEESETILKKNDQFPKEQIWDETERIKRKEAPQSYQSIAAKNAKTNRDFKPWQHDGRSTIDNLPKNTG